MNLFRKKDFLELAEVHNNHCISIYIPTHRGGGDAGEKQDMTNFKNQIKEVKNKLKEYNLTENEIEERVAPLNGLLDREDYWRRLSDGLAVFSYGNELKYYPLPTKFSLENYVGDHLYMKPLTATISDNQRFFIMVLSLGKMRFFDATAHTITEVEIEGLIPREMEESRILAGEENQQSLQWRSQQGEPSQGAMYHGHGDGTESEKKEDILKFFREIDEGLMEMLHDEKAPLVIAGVDYLYPIYKEANNYKNLYEGHLSGNFDEENPQEIHAQVWDMVKDDFTKDIHSKKEKYQELISSGKASDQLEEVIPGSIAGRIDTLFLQRGKHVWGTYDSTDHSISIDDEKTQANACLLNRAAIDTVKNGGEVYLLESHEMPDDVEAAAIYRYEMK